MLGWWRLIILWFAVRYCLRLYLIMSLQTLMMIMMNYSQIEQTQVFWDTAHVYTDKSAVNPFWIGFLGSLAIRHYSQHLKVTLLLSVHLFIFFFVSAKILPGWPTFESSCLLKLKAVRWALMDQHRSLLGLSFYYQIKSTRKQKWEMWYLQAKYEPIWVVFEVCMSTHGTVYLFLQSTYSVTIL